MTPATIIAKCRQWAHVNSTQYSDTLALQDINILKDEFWSEIVSRLQDDYNWQRWNATTVVLQSEYTIPEVTSTTQGAKVLKGVALNYDGETYDVTGGLVYHDAEEIDPENLQNDWDWYVENQPTDKPLYYVSDLSVFIAPAPTSESAGANRMRLTGLRNIPDYTISTTEAEVRLPVDFHRVLVYGLVPFALKEKGMDDVTVQNAENTYEKYREQAIRNISNRVDSAIEMQYPYDLQTTNYAVWPGNVW